MKNKISGLSEKETIMNFYIDRNELVVLNLMGEKIEGFTTIEEVKEKMIEQAKMYVQNASYVDDEVMKKIKMNKFLCHLAIIVGFISLIPIGAFIIIAANASNMIGTLLLITLGAGVLKGSQVLKTELKNQEMKKIACSDIRKYKKFLEYHELLKEYEKKRGISPININGLDFIDEVTLKQQLIFFSNSLKLMRYEEKQKEKVLKKELGSEMKSS